MPGIADTVPMDSDADTRAIPRPDVSVAQIILLILAQTGRRDFRSIVHHPLTRSLGTARSENSFYTALARLKQRRLITRTGDRVYELTASGEYAALKAYVRKEFTEAERGSASVSARTVAGRWDGRWRIVLFDFPEGKRPLHDYIRTILKRAGFREFQRSMWIYPYRVPAFIQKVMADTRLRNHARIITTSDIDYDDDLRRQFRLA